MGAAVEQIEHEIDGLPVCWRRAPYEGAPVVYVHGVPESSQMWERFLEKTGGIAPDLPGFGRSGKPAEGDYSIAGYDRFMEAFLDHLGVDRLRLVVHDWGAAALAFAQRFPERIERLVVIDGVPLLPGYRWHWVARLWRRRVIGELVMGTTNRWTLKRLSRLATPRPGPLPDSFVDAVWEHFDQGTQRAILRLYRSAPAPVLAAAGARLSSITAPSLVVWGEQDPYISPDFADAYAGALANATVERVPGAGHWPWIDRPELIERIASFAGAR
ncbi:MAG TPA: alpha/beta hydrolase [Solirubrobacteraceae bacterium]|nr:alpha/beta hydrolase [Solirubrobacteraceae bacterium]